MHRATLFTSLSFQFSSMGRFMLLVLWYCRMNSFAVSHPLGYSQPRNFHIFSSYYPTRFTLHLSPVYGIFIFSFSFYIYSHCRLYLPTCRSPVLFFSTFIYLRSNEPRRTMLLVRFACTTSACSFNEVKLAVSFKLRNRGWWTIRIPGLRVHLLPVARESRCLLHHGSYYELL